MRGVTLPAGRLLAPGVIHMDAPGHDLDRALRAAAGGHAPRSSGSASLLNARRHGDTRAGRRARRAVDQAAVQRLDQPAVRAHRADPRRAVRAPADPALVGRPSSSEGRAVADALGIDARRRSRTALVDEAARDQLRTTARACSRTSLARRRPRSPPSTAASSPRHAQLRCARRRCHEAIVDLIRGLEQSWSMRGPRGTGDR